MERALTPASGAAVRALIASRVLGEATLAPERLGDVTLFAHQREAIARVRRLLAEQGGALLADDVGLGKTYVAVALAREAGRPLVVHPASLGAMWSRALADAGVTAERVTYGAPSRGRAPPGEFGLVVLDEAHHARNPRTRRYDALARLASGARVLLLSATPVHNRRADLLALLALFLGARAWKITDAEIAALTVRRERADVALALSLPEAGAPVRVEIEDDSALLDAILGLPPPVPPRDGGEGGVLLAWTLVRQWASSRAALAGALRRRLARARALESALEAGRHPSDRELRAWTCADDAMQLAFPELVSVTPVENGALLAAVRAHAGSVRELLARVREDATADAGRARALLGIASAHAGEKVVAFTQFADTARALFQLARHRGGVAALTARGAMVAGGSLSRAEAIARFAPEASGVRAAGGAERIDLLITTDLSSEGINLQDASVVVHLDLPWTPARLEQRVGRSRRIGARHARTAVYALAPPASAERLLAVERRLAAKLRAAARTVGIAGTILPSLAAPPEREGAARLHELARTTLARWRTDEGPTAGERLVARVHGTRAALLVLARDGDQVRLAASLDDGEPTEDPAIVLEAIGLAEGADVPPERESFARAIVSAERWCARAAGAAIAGDAETLARGARRAALRRIAAIAARAPRHRRFALAPLATAARRAVIARYGIGAERVLDQLASAAMADEPWLRALSSFGALNARGDASAASSSGVELIAVLSVSATR